MTERDAKMMLGLADRMQALINSNVSVGLYWDLMREAQTALRTAAAHVAGRAEPVAWQDIAKTLCRVDGKGLFDDCLPAKQKTYRIRAQAIAALYAALPREQDVKPVAWRKHLKEHWLTQIECNHEEKTDRAMCWCGWASEPRSSVGGALDEWIDHVITVAPPSDSPGSAHQPDPKAPWRCIVCGEKLHVGNCAHQPQGGDGREDQDWNIRKYIDFLRTDEADSVTLLSDNPDFNGQPNCAIECNGYWTNFEDRRFAGDTIEAALELAYFECRQWRENPPPILTTPPAPVRAAAEPGDDLVLMPREATRTMTMAACDSLPACEHVFGHAGEMLRNAYRKMVEVAAISPASAKRGTP